MKNLIFLVLLSLPAWGQQYTFSPSFVGSGSPTASSNTNVPTVGCPNGAQYFRTDVTAIYFCNNPSNSKTSGDWVLITGTAPSPGIAVTPGSINYGTVQTGTSSEIQNVTITNTGNSDLSSLMVTLIGNTDFSSSNLSICNGTLVAGAACVVPFKFSPSSVGLEGATVTVAGSGVTSQLTTLTGTGTASASFVLTVNCGGTGSGTVVSDETPTPLINVTCTNGVPSGTFSSSYASGATPVLTATATGGSTFSGFSGGGCTSSPCTLSISAATTVTASFAAASSIFTLNITGGGQGGGATTSDASALGGGGILNCASAAGVVSSGGNSGCSGSFNQGTVVTLTESPDASSTFAGWSGPCSGTATTCAVTLNGNTTATASFTPTSVPTSLVQTTTNCSVASTTIACTWPLAQNSGDTNVCFGGWPDATTTVVSVADSKSNSYTQVPTISPKVGTGLTQVAYYSQPIVAAAAGANTTTMTLSAAVSSVSFTSLTTGGSSVAGTAFTTASVTPSANNLVLINVVSKLASGNGACAVSSISGNSETYAKVASRQFGIGQGTGTVYQQEVWRGLVASPTAGVITINYGCSPTSVSWDVSQASGVDLTGTNGSGAIGITASNNASGAGPATVTMGSFGSAANATYGAAGANGSFTGAGTSMTLLGNNSNGTSLPATLDEKATGNVSPVTAALTGASYWSMIGVEIKVPQNRRDMRCLEYSGASGGIDTSAAAIGTSSSASSGALPATTVANDIVLGAALSNQSVLTPSTGYTQEVKNSFGDDVEDQKGVASGATPTFAPTLSASGNWVSMNIGFKASATTSTASLTVVGSGGGSGTVSGSGGTPAISCTIASGVASGACSASVILGGSITLNAVPDSNSVFAGWSGITGCSTSSQCIVPNLTGNATVTAQFAPNNVTNYFVATTGSDSTGTGSQAKPWATIGQADSVICGQLAPCGSGGAVVHVAAGTYSGNFATSRGGLSATARVRFLCDTQYSCKLTGSGSGSVLWRNFAQFISIEGFEFDGSTFTDHIAIYNQYDSANFACHNQILNNKVHDFCSAGGCTNGPGVLSTNGADLNPPALCGNTYSGNLIYHNDGGGASTFVSGNADDALSPGWGDIMQNNIIMDQGGGRCMSPTHTSNHTIVTNNIMVNCAGGGMIIANTQTNGLNDFSTFSNNIIANNGSASSAPGIRVFHTGGCGPHNIYANNLMYGNAGGNYLFDTGCTNTSQGTVSGTNTSVFVNYTGTSTGNYQSVPTTSPAIDAGTTLCALTVCVPAVDFLNVIRPQGANYDIGAYESF